MSCALAEQSRKTNGPNTLNPGPESTVLLAPFATMGSGTRPTNVLCQQLSALVATLSLFGCNGLDRGSGPENVVPTPSALGSKTIVSSVRSIKGSDLTHLARAMGGKGTIFNVWASWCGSCKGELPRIRDFANEYASKGLRVVIVSVDEPENYSRLPEIAASFGFLPPIWVASRPLGEFKWALAQNWKGNIPVTFLYDAKGKRRYFWDGPVEATELRPTIDDFLAGNNVQGEKHFALAPGVTDDDSANVP